MTVYEQLPVSTQHIPPSELWELINDLRLEVERQGAALRESQARVLAQESEIDRLRAQFAVGQAETRVSIPKTSQNSSLPPASHIKPNQVKNSERTLNRRPRQGLSREQQIPDVILDCVPAACEHCGADLGAGLRREIGRQQVVELPEIKAVVVELVRYERTCKCGHCQRDAYPVGYQAPHQTFGPRLHALINYLNGTHHVAQDRLRQLLKDLFQLDISAGAVVNSLHYTACQLEAPAQAILDDLRQAEVIGSDETSLRYDGQNGWLWVLQNQTASYFAAVTTRAGQVLRDLLGDAHIPLWVSDLYAGQLSAPAEHFAICNAHQLRDLQYAVDSGDPVFAPAMQQLLREGLLLTRLREDWLPADYQAAVERIRSCALTLLGHPTDHKVARRLQKRFRKHFESMWRFLDDPDAPFDNNASERALRPAVIHRKVIGGFRSLWGAIAYARYRSIEDTARKRGQSIWDALFAALGQPLSLPLQLAL